MAIFVTDRTKAHVDRLKALAAKGWNNMSPSEQSEWLGESGDTWKGAYNYTDLNRVESAVQEISDRWGLGLITKTDWSASNIPRTSDIDRYFDNVRVVADSYVGSEDIPELPLTNIISYEYANDIERILEAAYKEISSGSAVLGQAVLGVAVLGKE